MQTWRVFCYLPEEDELESGCPCTEPLALEEARALMWDLDELNEGLFGDRACKFFLKADGCQKYKYLETEEEQRLVAIEFDPVQKGMWGRVCDGIEDCNVLFDESEKIDFSMKDGESRSDKHARAMVLLAKSHPALHRFLQ